MSLKRPPENPNSPTQGGIKKPQLQGAMQHPAATIKRPINTLMVKPSRVKAMKRDDFSSMSLDELWALRSEISSVLTSKISAEKTELERRLRELRSNTLPSEAARRERRPYPRVFPKYRNPADPTETWAGRGRQPRWVTEQLRSGRKLEDFRIRSGSSARRSDGGRNLKRAQGRA